MKKIKSEKKTIIGYGASAKFIQVSNMCNLNNTLIDYVIDTTPDKQNKYTPKSKIPIKKYDDESLKNVDYCFLGAWNIKFYPNIQIQLTLLSLINYPYFWYVSYELTTIRNKFFLFFYYFI